MFIHTKSNFQFPILCTVLMTYCSSVAKASNLYLLSLYLISTEEQLAALSLYLIKAMEKLPP